MIPHHSKLTMMTHLRKLYDEEPQHNIFDWDEYPDHLFGIIDDAMRPAWHLEYYFGALLTYEVAPEDYGADVVIEPKGVKICGDVYMTYGRALG